MDKRRMMLDAIDEIYGADDDGSEHPEMFGRRVTIAVEQCWRDDITIEELIKAARAKLKGGAH